MLELNKIYFEDCLVGMRKIDDESIDMILCDLPFFRVAKEQWDNNWENENKYLEWINLLLVEYNRILKDNSNLFLFTSRQYNRKICNLLDSFFIEKRIIIWSRKRNFNNTRGRALASGYEPICFYSKGSDSTFNNIKIQTENKRKEYLTGILKDGITLSDVWNDIPALSHNSKEKLNHPTQKPLKLIERIIQLGSNETNIVLDNCAGSGTTLLAAKNLKRNFIGFENNEEYFKIIQKRLE